VNIVLLTLNNFTHDTRIHRTATALSQAGNHVTVLALWQQGLAQKESNPNGYYIERIHLASRSWKNRLLGPMVKYLEYSLKVWIRANKVPVDIYHANDANTLPAGWLAAKRNRAGLVYDAHELETGRNWTATRLAGFYKNIHAWPEKMFIHQANAVITVNQSIASRLVELYHISHPAVVMNCPDPRVEIYSAPNRLRRELHIPDSLKIILYQGNITRGRGIEPLIEAVQTLAEAALVILGDGALLSALQDRIDKGEIQRVYLPGKVQPAELPSYTAAADLGAVLIEPTCESYRLSLPNKFFEYLHAGLPIIGSNIPELNRLILSEDVGIVVDPNNPSEVKIAIQELLDSPQKLAYYRSRAYMAAQKYTWDNERQVLLDLYASLMQNPGKPS
jgi:glycosyltransferase involved in cell wall biosynthesis